jgi:hypothetical protein
MAPFGWFVTMAIWLSSWISRGAAAAGAEADDRAAKSDDHFDGFTVVWWQDRDRAAQASSGGIKNATLFRDYGISGQKNRVDG